MNPHAQRLITAAKKQAEPLPKAAPKKSKNEGKKKKEQKEPNEAKEPKGKAKAKAKAKSEKPKEDQTEYSKVKQKFLESDERLCQEKCFIQIGVEDLSENHSTLYPNQNEPCIHTHMCIHSYA